LRVKGRVDTSVKMAGGNGKALFYSVNTSVISVISEATASVARIYEVSTECVICMDRPATVVFVCGHFCACAKCVENMHRCCMCRAAVQTTVDYEG